MADTYLNLWDEEKNQATQKWRDLGDTSYANSIVNEGPSSSNISCSSYSNATLSTLVTTVNSYLEGSTKRLVSIIHFSDGASTPTFYCIVTENTI